MRWHLIPFSRFFEGPLAFGAGIALARAAELRLPRPVLGLLMKAYSAWLDVDMNGVLTPQGGFGCFGDFFARRLRPEYGPICAEPGTLVSPCDGSVQQRSAIDTQVLDSITIKGCTVSLGNLIGDADVAASLVGGTFCVIYLHPRDYHRVHVPIDGILSSVRHVPGARYPVASWASGLTDEVLSRNERVAFDFELTPAGPRCVVLMVAAFGVGGIESPYLSRGMRGNRKNMAEAVARGDDLGAFRIGSTVLLLLPAGAVELDRRVTVGSRVLAGQVIGRLCSTSSGEP